MRTHSRGGRSGMGRYLGVLCCALITSGAAGVTAGHAVSSLAPRTRAADTSPHIVTGTIAFTKQVIGTGVMQSHAPVAADFDGDGDIDVAATDYVNGVVYWYENVGGSFVSHVLDPNLEGAYPLSVGDVNRDGNVDVLACGYLADVVAWYENDGNANFTRHDVDTTANGPHCVIVVDLDRDGDNDLLTANQDASSILWYENDGSQNFTRHTIDTDAAGAKRADAADLDGDGDLDVVSAAFYGNAISWYTNDGSENFTKHVIDPAADGAYFVSLVDVDGDGDIDIFAASELDNTVGLYLNDGSGVFTTEVIDSTASGARCVVAVDLDGDGDIDAVGTSPDANRVAWYENQGGVFTRHAIDVGSAGAYGVFPIDVDQNGRVDVVCSSRDANTVAIHTQGRVQELTLAHAGDTAPITSWNLRTADADTGPDQLTYTLDQAPTAGELELNGIPVPQGGTFTQADVDAFRVTYAHDGSATLQDGFSFTVSDGTSSASGRFVIRVVGLDTGLVAYWPLDESSGTVAADVAGTHPGTLVNGPVWEPAGGEVGGALALDGVDDYVDIGTLDVGGAPGFTAAMWIRPHAFASSPRLISKATSTQTESHYWMVSTINESALRFRIKAGGTTSTLASGPQLELDRWYHVACTYDQNEMRIYGNGELIATMPKTGVPDGNTSVPAAIGNQPPGAGSAPFAGEVDDVRIYARALNAAEVAVLAQAGPTGIARTLTSGAYLDANYPNPFNPLTTIRYGVPATGRVSLNVYDVTGRLVATLVDAVQRPVSSGHTVTWDGRDRTGHAAASGVYFYRLATGGFVQTRKMVLLR